MDAQDLVGYLETLDDGLETDGRTAVRRILGLDVLKVGPPGPSVTQLSARTCDPAFGDASGVGLLVQCCLSPLGSCQALQRHIQLSSLDGATRPPVGGPYAEHRPAPASQRRLADFVSLSGSRPAGLHRSVGLDSCQVPARVVRVYDPEVDLVAGDPDLRVHGPAALREFGGNLLFER